MTTSPPTVGLIGMAISTAVLPIVAIQTNGVKLDGHWSETGAQSDTAITPKKTKKLNTIRYHHRLDHDPPVRQTKSLICSAAEV